MSAKQRNHSLLSTKQKALSLLGARRDGSFGPASLDETTNKPHTVSSVAAKLTIQRTAVYNWKKNAASIMSADTSEPSSKKKKIVRTCEHPDLERSLYTYVMWTRIVFMKGESIFKEDAIRQVTFQLRDELVKALKKRLEVEREESLLKMIRSNIASLESFKASKHWFLNFMDRNKFSSFEPRSQNGIQSQATIEVERQTIRERICCADPKDIANTAEISVLYRSLPSRASRTADKPTCCHTVKDRITAVLTVFGDGTKGPLVVIGKSARPKSFPKSFDPVRDLGIYYYSQKEAWNTQQLWTKQMKSMDNSAYRQGRKLLHLVDNSSAHAIDSSTLDNIETIFFPPKMTSVLQPVDASIGRSFKAVFRRLLIKHVVNFVNKEMEKPAGERVPFKITRAVSVYDAVRLMATAWNLVPVSVVVNGWLSCKIFAPHQQAEVEAIRKFATGRVELARIPPIGVPLQSEKEVYIRRAREAKERGENYLKSPKQSTTDVQQDDPDIEIDSNSKWLLETMHRLSADLRELKSCSVIHDVDINGMGKFFEQEEKEFVCQPISEESAIHDSVACVLSDSENNAVFTEEEDFAVAEVELKPSLSRMENAANTFQNEMRLLLAEQPALHNRHYVELMRLVDMEIAHTKVFRRSSTTQGKLRNTPEAKTLEATSK